MRPGRGFLAFSLAARVLAGEEALPPTRPIAAAAVETGSDDVSEDFCGSSPFLGRPRGRLPGFTGADPFVRAASLFAAVVARPPI